MAKVAVVITYDDEELPHPDLALNVVDRVRNLFVSKGKFEVHLANGNLATHIENVLADRRVAS